MRKSMLSVAIASSCLVIASNAYAVWDEFGNLKSNVGDTVFEKDVTETVQLANGTEVNGYKNGFNSSTPVEIVGTNNITIHAGTTDSDTVTFAEKNFYSDGIIGARENATLTIDGGKVVVKQEAVANKQIHTSIGIRSEDNAKVTLSNKETVVNAEFDGFKAGIPNDQNKPVLVSALDNSKMTFDHKLTLNGTLKGSEQANMLGIYTIKASTLNAKEDVNVNLTADNNSQGTHIYAVQAQHTSTMNFGGNLTINLDVTNTTPLSANDGGSLAVNASGGKITIAGDLNVNAKYKGSKQITNTVLAQNGGELEVNGHTNVVSDGQFGIVGWNGGKATLNGDVSINTANTSDKYWSNLAIGANGGVVNINQNSGKKVNINGGVYLINNGTVNMKLDTADSVFSGSIIESGNAGGTSTLNMSNGAKWLVSQTMAPGGLFTQVTNLNLANNAVIDVTADQDTYQQINIGTFSGTGGSFILNTDLASQNKTDKIEITNSTAGATAFIQVKDASLVNGEVTGLKSLLVAEDQSGNATFVGKNLNTGGLWDVTPTIENGLNTKDENGVVIGTQNQWYLTKLDKALNNDTQVLVENAHTTYALWMNLTDTLRQRLGNVRNHASDSDSLWSRYVGGEFGDANYNVLQVGYDKAFNANSLYGIAVETGVAEDRYFSGKEKDKVLAFSLYGVWTGDDGSYLDAVAKIGRVSYKLNSYGDNPDSADFKKHAYGLSFEYGKRIDFGLNQNLFVEPQVQVKYTRLNGTNYTTERGTSVHTDNINSLVGRVGALVGFKTENGSQFYAKASVLNEFAARSNQSLSAANGDNTILNHHYRDTWIELGFGANIKLSDSSYFYGDVERSIKGSIDKKWQINAGLRFEF